MEVEFWRVGCRSDDSHTIAGKGQREESEQ